MMTKSIADTYAVNNIYTTAVGILKIGVAKLLRNRWQSPKESPNLCTIFLDDVLTFTSKYPFIGRSTVDLRKNRDLLQYDMPLRGKTLTLATSFGTSTFRGLQYYTYPIRRN